MTREEKAIMYFKDMRKKFCEDYLLGIPKDSVAYKATMAEKEFYDTAIKALSQEPKYCDRNICLKNEYNGIGCDECKVTKSQEPKTGHWIECDGWDGDVYYECSVCSEPFVLIDGTPADNLYNYCPNCGAKMVEPQERSDKE